MKSLLSTFIAASAVLLSSPSLFADEQISVSNVPKPMQEFVANTFGSSVKIVSAERENEYGTYHYDLDLSNGVKIDFDANQQWTEIDCEKSKDPVPLTVISKSIEQHVKSTYPCRSICKIERKYKGYEITLSDGLELYYNRNGEFVRED